MTIYNRYTIYKWAIFHGYDFETMDFLQDFDQWEDGGNSFIARG